MKEALISLINCGKFPAPVKVGRASLWLASDINQWIVQTTNLEQEGE